MPPGPTAQSQQTKKPSPPPRPPAPLPRPLPPLPWQAQMGNAAVAAETRSAPFKPSPATGAQTAVGNAGVANNLVDPGSGPQVETAGAGTVLPMPEDEISLKSGSFTPTPAVAAYLESLGSEGGLVKVAFGALARDQIHVVKVGDAYKTIGNGHQAMALAIPALQPLEQVKIMPVLAIKIKESAIEGYLTIAVGEAVGKPKDLVDKIQEHAVAMGWLGMKLSKFPATTNEFKDGTLKLEVNDFAFELGGFMEGTGTFGLTDETVTFQASATVAVKNLTQVELNVERDENGNLSGEVDVPIELANFSGSLHAALGNGTVEIQGMVRYETEKLKGEVNLLVTDKETAGNVARQKLGVETVTTSAEEAAGTPETGPKPGPRAMAGWGTLVFAFNEWLTGKAEVIIDGNGDLTLIGEITPPAEVELFKQRDYIRDIFKVEVHASYGIPLVGNLFLFANIGMQALAKLGPGKIYNIVIKGTYSTAPDIPKDFSIEATLKISAFAGLRLRAEGGAGVEILGHDIKAGVGLNALAGVRGYVEATPTIGYRETAEPKEGKKSEFFIKGHMEIAAQPFLGLSGDLFVELDSPWWSPAPDKKWTWPIGSLEYPLPGEFGIGADVDYVLGSDKLPEVKFSEVKFNKDKFMSDLLNDKLPKKSGGEKEKQGEWKEGGKAEGSEKPALTDSGGSSTQTATTTSQQKTSDKKSDKDKNVPAEDKEKKWQEGLEDLGKLAEKSRKKPLTRAALDTQLTKIKQKYGFSALKVVPNGENWLVFPSMSPGGDKSVTFKATERKDGDEAGDTEDFDKPLPQTEIYHTHPGSKAGFVYAAPLTENKPTTGEGSRPKSSPDFPDFWPKVTIIDPKHTDWVRMHLLNQHLYGTGNDAWNLTPGDKVANKSMETQFESGAKSLVKKRKAIWYRVEITYRDGDDADFPKYVTMCYGKWVVDPKKPKGKGKKGDILKGPSNIPVKPPVKAEVPYIDFDSATRLKKAGITQKLAKWLVKERNQTPFKMKENLISRLDATKDNYLIKEKVVLLDLLEKGSLNINEN